jgi:hypothetical protein
MADEANKEIAALEAPVERPAGNTAERLFRLEQMNGALQKRIEFLEENQTKNPLLIREEAMRLLGLTFCSIGEQLLTGATSCHTYKAVVVSDEQPINDQSFYARRVDPTNPGLWAYHVLQGGQAVDVILERLAEPMRVAIKTLVASIPADVESVAFNVYKAS